MEIKDQIRELREKQKRLKQLEKIKKQNDAFQEKMKKSNKVFCLFTCLQQANINPEKYEGGIDKVDAFLKELEKYFKISMDLKRLRNCPTLKQITKEELIDLVYCFGLDWAIEIENEYKKLNDYPVFNCCICLEEKLEIYNTRMKKKKTTQEVNAFVFCCDCKIDICNVCVQKIGKCPTCRQSFTHYELSVK